jgi:hypothetical protein
MKPLMMGLLIGLFTVGFPACPPPMPPAPLTEVDAGPIADTAPPPTPMTEASPGPASSDCALACAALVTATCPLGSQLDCTSVLTRDLGSGKYSNAATGKPLTCIDVKAVRTKAAAVQMGFTCQ